MDQNSLKKAIVSNAKDGKIPCALCFNIAEEVGVSKRRIGEILDEMNIRITKCQLGCFE